MAAATARDTNLSGNAEIGVYPNSMNISYIPRYLNRYGKKRFCEGGFSGQRFCGAAVWDRKKRGVIKEGQLR